MNHFGVFQLVGESVVAGVVSALCALGGSTVLVLRPYRVDAAEELVSKYNRRAAKIGSDPIRLRPRTRASISMSKGQMP